jgi:lysophospholipase L1-like esterase
MKKTLIICLTIIAASTAFFVIGHPFSAQNSKASIVALGDSVAAGEGLQTVESPSKTDAACNRSKDAYPVVLSKETSMNLYQFACSGAKTSSGLLSTQNAAGMNLVSQIDQAQKNIYGNIVTITIGANDVGWSDVLHQCAQEDCASDQRLESQLETSKQSLNADLRQALQTIKTKQPKQIIITTYYKLISDSDTCLSGSAIKQDNLRWFNQQTDSLNKIIADAAAANGASLVSINFSNHTLCDQDSWIQGILDPAPIHPTVDGQKQIAKQIINLIRN